MGSLKNNWFSFFALIYSVLFCFFSIDFVLGMKLFQINPSYSTFVRSKMWHFVDVSFRNFWLPNFWLLILLWCKNIFNINFSWKYVETIKSSISGKPVLFEILRFMLQRYFVDKWVNLKSYFDIYVSCCYHYYIVKKKNSKSKSCVLF